MLLALIAWAVGALWAVGGNRHCPLRCIFHILLWCSLEGLQVCRCDWLSIMCQGPAGAAQAVP